ncbi:DUF1837 domain-containing protein [Pseudomonas sp. GD03858]|uniref:HamA C-terminal domain-containing protein n=1 Tax=unclassified Pseudomonas TaxID=196821 RepID=UPI00244C31A2|nr:MULTISPECIES: DUF1837 domain-containing protein [unclassified Pseudomonas]MDH0645231.1 DUF1837 domain-containing protein [Pseudomonas sp. GD03867]MDH0660853.1 DUF1837 domain-containing protein [Pseudomonas sp. GD03858]
MEFSILIDCHFDDLKLIEPSEVTAQKKVLSVVNDYEDGKWRYAKFQDFIWDNIAETSLSQRERESLGGKPSSLLRAAAKNLRLTDKEGDIGRGSELAEIVLYGIMKHQYSALPVVPKIFYKQNSQDNAKGADSVHIVLEEEDFSIWFGEAKFYTSIEDARLGSIIMSVENALDTNKLKKENSIITNVSDLDGLCLDVGLVARIKVALSNQASIDGLKPRLNIPILLLHECDITNGCKVFSQEYESKVVEFHRQRALAYFKKQAEQLGAKVFLYSEIKFHIILFPVPKKAPIVDKFVSKVEFLRDE